jgi:hypothetical protein
MNRFRFSLLTLLAFVSLSAVASAALANPTKVWAVGVSTCTFAVIAFASVAGLCGHYATRAFWLGFAVVALLYVFLRPSFDSWAWGGMGVGPGGVGGLHRASLATTWMLEWLYELKTGNAPSLSSNGEVLLSFFRIGQSLWAICIGFSGGLVGRWLYLRRERAMPTN